MEPQPLNSAILNRIGLAIHCIMTGQVVRAGAIEDEADVFGLPLIEHVQSLPD